jgi:hypothetical protein
MWDEMSKVGVAVAERYVSSFCWLRRWAGQWVRRSVALQSCQHAARGGHDACCRWWWYYSQIDDDIGVHVALELLPARAAKRVLALLGAEVDDGIEEGEVEAPHLDPRAP